MTYPRHLPNCVIPAKAGTQADGSVAEDDIGKARVSVDGIEGTTNVVFTDASAPAQLGMYTLESALLVVEQVRQRLALDARVEVWPTSLCIMRRVPIGTGRAS